MDKKIIAGFAVMVAVLIGGAVVLTKPQKTYANLEEFARCLAVKQITMYGADWCPHCQREKKAFGEAFAYVPYVECPDNPKVCTDRGVSGYPTWIWPDGKKLEGEQGLEKLSSQSGCALE